MSKAKQETMIPRREMHRVRQARRGRPGTDVRALARAHSTAALARLVELTQDPNSCVALAACRVVLDRGYGKVPATFKGEPGPVPERPPLNVKITRIGMKGQDHA